MIRRGDVKLLLFVLVVTFLSTSANRQQFETDYEKEFNHNDNGRHHPNQHHHHNHHHHDNTVAEDDHGNGLTSQEDDTGLQPSQRHEYLEEYEEFYDDYSSRRELFQLTDRDGDGFVTRDEYVLQNGNTTAVVDQVFMAYDGDGDGRFSEEEFLQQSSPLEVHAECEEQIIQTCDKLYLELKTSTTTANKLDEPGCKAVQYLVDCVAGFDTECNIKSYAQAVLSRANSYLDSGVCPLLYLQNLLKVSGQAGLFDTKKTRLARSIEDVEITTVSDKQLYGKHCPDAFINRCAQKFEKSLGQESPSNYCPVLASYAHCLKKRVKHCHADVENPLLRQNMARLKNLQSTAKSCRTNHRSPTKQ